MAQDGHIYVAEGAANRITELNPDGTRRGDLGQKGQGRRPVQRAVGHRGGAGRQRVRRGHLEPSHPEVLRRWRFPLRWGTVGDAKGSADTDANVFWGPRSVAIGPDGEVYVTDTGNKRIQVFDPDGHFMRMFGGDGAEPGKFHEPVGVAVDPAAMCAWPTPGISASRSSTRMANRSPSTR